MADELKAAIAELEKAKAEREDELQKAGAAVLLANKDELQKAGAVVLQANNDELQKAGAAVLQANNDELQKAGAAALQAIDAATKNSANTTGQGLSIGQSILSSVVVSALVSGVAAYLNQTQTGRQELIKIAATGKQELAKIAETNRLELIKVAETGKQEMQKKAREEWHKFFENETFPRAKKFIEENLICAKKAQDAYETLLMVTQEGKVVDNQSRLGRLAEDAFVKLYDTRSSPDFLWANLIDPTLLNALKEHHDFIAGTNFQRLTSEPLIVANRDKAIEQSRELHKAVVNAAQLCIMRINERSSSGKEIINSPPPG